MALGRALAATSDSGRTVQAWPRPDGELRSHTLRGSFLPAMNRAGERKNAMRTMQRGWALLALLTTCMVDSAAAQGGAGRYYNPQTEIAAQGTVAKVETVTSGQGWYGVHLILKSQNRDYDVRLGPSDFIAQNKFTFAAGDAIEVWGSQIRPSLRCSRRSRNSNRRQSRGRNSYRVKFWSLDWRVCSGQSFHSIRLSQFPKESSAGKEALEAGFIYDHHRRSSCG